MADPTLDDETLQRLRQALHELQREEGKLPLANLATLAEQLQAEHGITIDLRATASVSPGGLWLIDVVKTVRMASIPWCSLRVPEKGSI